MAHSAQILAPACAWAESAQPKQRSHSIASRLSFQRLGNAICAMKPVVRKERSTEEKICVFNAVDEVESRCSSKRTELPDRTGVEEVSDDDISTQAGSSIPSSSCGSSDSLSESLEEVSSRDSSPLLPGSVDVFSMNFQSRTSQLDDMAIVIASRARSKRRGAVHEEVRNAFLAADIDRTGRLSRTEAIAFCQYFDLSSDIASRFLMLLDPHETGSANWSSFMDQYAAVFNKTWVSPVEEKLNKKRQAAFHRAGHSQRFSILSSY